MIRHAKAIVAVSVLLSTLLAGASLAFALQTHSKGEDLDAVPGGAYAFQGLAVDQSGGAIYAVDLYDPNTFAHGMLHRFGADGSYDQAFATATASFSETLIEPKDVAFDNSATSSEGTLYVANSAANRVEAIDASGAAVASFGTSGQINGAEDSPGDPDTVPTGGFSSPCGLAVEQTNANLFVADQNNNRIWIFDSSGAYLGRILDSALNGPCGIAFSSTGELYVRNANDGKVLRFTRKGATEYEFGSTFYAPDNGTPADSSDDLPAATDVAVDTTSGNVYVDRGNRIAEYDSAGSPVSSFGQDDLGGSSAGIALNPTATAVYASAGNRIATFGPLITVADVTTGSATNVIDTAATLHGNLDPVGIETTECSFEWGTDTTYGNSAPCTEGDAFNAAQAVSAELTGLSAATTYHYRLVVANAEGESRGQDRTFTAVGPPTLKQIELSSSFRPVTFVSGVSAKAATLNAELNPNGAATTWHFEYVEEAAYQASGFASATKAPVPDGELDAGTSPLPVSAALSDLKPGTHYRYRILASNLAGPLTGPERSFRTDPLTAPTPSGQFPGQAFLPDGRVWEMVSPPEKNGGGVGAFGASTAVSPDGERIAYANKTGFGDTQGSGFLGSVQYLATRSAEGWSSHAVLPTPEPSVNQSIRGQLAYFSSDLTATAIQAPDLPSVSGDVLEDPYNLYRADLAGGPLAPITTPQGGFTSWSLGATFLIGGDTDFRHIFFWSRQQFTPSAPLSTPNVWEWEDGALRLAGILPDGSVPPGGSRPAWGSGFKENKDTVSSDGLRVLFLATPTASSPTQLYMRRDHTETVWISESEGTAPVAEPADILYEAASSDLHHVAFTTSSRLTDEDPGGSGDQALYLYTDSPNPGSEANLEFIHRGGSTTAAGSGLSVPGISEDGSRGFVYGNGTLFRWDEAGTHPVFKAPIGSPRRERSREETKVSVDGTVIAFRSDRQLTEEELGENSGVGGGQERFPALYVYDAKTDELRCASCPPSGARTGGTTHVYPFAEGEEGLQLGFFLPNFLTRDGRHAYFSTLDALVPEDVNGRYDAYQYDIATGEPHLLSSGHSDRDSWFANVSASGEDAFIITREALSAHDIDTAYDLYDARVGGGIPEPSPPPTRCEGDACQPPPVELRDPTPASAAFNGPDEREQRATRKRCRRVGAQRGGQKQRGARKAAKRCRAQARAKQGARR